MEQKNKFYIFKSGQDAKLMTQSYDLYDGHLKTEDGVYGYPYAFNVETDRPTHGDYTPVFAAASGYVYHSIQAVMFDDSDNYLGYRVYQYGPWTSDGKTVMPIISGTRKIYFNIAISGEFVNSSRQWFKVGYLVKPHYKEIKKKYKKENGQVFFRESLDGKINLFGIDYELINNCSLEETIGFEIYRNNLLYASSVFNKSDCKFDHTKKNVELKLTYNDKYTKILDAYENTYDLIKLAPAITPVFLTKRCIVQIYIQGENVISSYAGGTYWETEVNEPIDDHNLLARKYHFAHNGEGYVEISLEDFNYDINNIFKEIPDSNIWDGVTKGSVVFRKVKNALDAYNSSEPRPYLMSDGETSGLVDLSVGGSTPDYHYRYDAYVIEIYSGTGGTGTKIYSSKYTYCKDGNFTLAQGEDLYPMQKSVNDAVPAEFNLGDKLIEYRIWGRLLCDVDKLQPQAEGEEAIDTYDLPYDDFATPRRNYKKCVGLIGFDSPNSVVKVYQSTRKSDEPTSYGIDDYGQYFLPPNVYGQYYYPLARNSWGNTSLWVMLTNSFESWCSKSYKEYKMRDSYHIADVIKCLLLQIDPTITHDKTAEYSSFLYGHSGATSAVLGNCDIYITQKTNILKGEYDQAAQKAEIKFKQLMEMLRDCFRCYWFIDEYNRFRIEHISFFMKGLSYNAPTIQFDLTKKYDKFNKKVSLYCQQETEFDKTELAARFEFNWMDDVTDSMGNLQVDINNKYIQKDKTEEINIDGFTSDVDYMLFLPDDFSNDGFALLMANTSKRVPIVHQYLRSEKQFNYTYSVYPQNWYASFNQLIWHYMEDMPGDDIKYNNLDYVLGVNNVKKCLKHEIEFPSNDIQDFNIYKLITTELGDGYIEEVSTNIDTDLMAVELRYSPR